MRAVVVVAFLVSLSSPSFADHFVRDGKPVGEFVVGDAPHGAITFATEDVRGWLEKITGARVPILHEPSAADNEKIFVGARFAGGFTQDLEKLKGADGFAVRRQGKHVYVFGSRPRGTLYGLYAFLEKNTDLIFARPHEDFGTVHGESRDLTLEETDFIDIPVFNVRTFAPNWPRHRATGIWLLRNRDNRRDRRANYKGFMELDLIEYYNCNFAVPIARHAEEHPEYFGWDPVRGTRKFVKHGEGTMCLSVPELPAVWAKGLAEDVARYEKRVRRPIEFVRMGPGDNWFCCQCEKCTAPIMLPDGSVLECKDPDSIKDPLFRSTQVMMFLNKAMETWRTLRPDLPLHVLAYIHFAEPPRVPVHPDLGIWFAPYPTNNMHYPLLDSRQTEPWRRRFAKWLTMSPRLGLYEYHFAKPSPEAFAAAENLKALLRNPDHRNALVYAEMSNDTGSAGIGNGALGWDVGLMNHWVIARLFWDPTQDVDELYRYFIRRTYREAAPQMQAYFDLIRKSWLDPRNRTWTSAHANIAKVYTGMVVDRGLEKECLRHLSEAEAAAKHPVSKTLIRRMRDRYGIFARNLARLIVARIPEMKGDHGDFDSIQWEKPVVCDDFKQTRRDGKTEEASVGTTIQAAHDGETLYLRFRAEGSSRAGKAQAGGGERWPAGDRVELWLFGRNHSYVFALNGRGEAYDARNLDRAWTSGWKVRARTTDKGWEAVATLPLSALGMSGANPTSLRWFATRDVAGGEKISYQGHPLYYRNFPVEVR